MDISKLSTESIKSAFHLVQQREQLEAELAKVNAKLIALFEGKQVPATKPFVAKGPAAEKTKKAKSVEKASKAREKKSRGAVQKNLLEYLKSAGEAGVTAKQIAKDLGMRNQNIHVWFGGTGKKYPQIVKLGRGHWAWSHNAPVAASVSEAAPEAAPVEISGASF